MNESAVYEDRRGVTRVRGPMASPVVPKARGRGSERDPSWPANADLRGGRWMWCFFFQAEDGIRDLTVTGVQTCALPIIATFYDIHILPPASQGGGSFVTVIATPSPKFVAGEMITVVGRAAKIWGTVLYE